MIMAREHPLDRVPCSFRVVSRPRRPLIPIAINIDLWKLHIIQSEIKKTWFHIVLFCIRPELFMGLYCCSNGRPAGWSGGRTGGQNWPTNYHHSVCVSPNKSTYASQSQPQFAPLYFSWSSPCPPTSINMCSPWSASGIVHFQVRQKPKK